VGDQLKEDTDVGPLISEQAAEEVEAFVNGAVKAGAKVQAGGKRHGAFMEPTVLTNITVDMPLFEAFDLEISVRHPIDDAVRPANDSDMQSGFSRRYQQA
jgi:acyl-CoA reductase-like NAD-dependent aldehyde dehydrogenase